MPDKDKVVENETTETVVETPVAPENKEKSLEEKLLEVSNQNKGLQKLQSEKDKAISELTDKISKYEGLDPEIVKKMKADMEVLNSENELLKTKVEVVAEVGLDIALIDRLKGKTKEEIKADAEQLKSLFKTPDQKFIKEPEPKVDPKPKGMSVEDFLKAGKN